MGDLRDTINALSMVNAGLQTTTQYIYDRKAGDPNAASKFIFNLGGSAARIGQADWLASRTGNYLGYTFNAMIPFTDPATNAFALGAAAFMTPYAGGFGLGCRAPMPMLGLPFMAYTPMTYMPMWGGLHHHHHCHSSFTSFSIKGSLC